MRPAVQLVGATLVELDDLRRHGGAVLDGVDARFERDLNAFGAFDMGHDGQAEAMGGPACRRRDIRLHAQDAWFAGLDCVEHAAGDEELDDVGAARDEFLDLCGGFAGRGDDAGE